MSEAAGSLDGFSVVVAGLVASAPVVHADETSVELFKAGWQPSR